jgi:hypothetical protein
MEVKLVSMAGSYIVNKKWYKKFASSWDKIKCRSNVHVMDDNTLGKREKSIIKSLGHRVIGSKEAEKKVNSKLKKYQSLRKLRKKSIMFKKLIDTTIMCGESDRILYIDSDVYVRRKIGLPKDIPDMLFTVADVTGYSGSPLLPIFVPTVVGLNGGILLYNPEICDWGFLDELAEKYLLGWGRPWWLEQTCWAALAGRTQKKGVFDGRDVRNVSGLKKRTPEEVRSNVSKWVGNSEPYEDSSIIEEMVEGSSIVHFAGPGERLIDRFATTASKNGPQPNLRWSEVENAAPYERVMISLRMA